MLCRSQHTKGGAIRCRFPLRHMLNTARVCCSAADACLLPPTLGLPCTKFLAKDFSCCPVHKLLMTSFAAPAPPTVCARTLAMPNGFHASCATNAIPIILGSPCPALSLPTTHTGLRLALCSPTFSVWTKAPGAPQTSSTPMAKTGAFPHTTGRIWQKRATAGEHVAPTQAS